MKRLWILLLILILLPSNSATAKRSAPDVLETDPMQLNPKMARFLVQQIKPDLPRKIRLNALLNAIFSKDGLNIQYGNTKTLTAAETFESRTGNCLSFTILFVAMARHLGLHASFKEVSEVTSRDVRGELLLANYHMFAEVEIDNGIAAVDFLPGADKSYKSVRRISAERATAHYFNNLGAEILAQGDEAEAVRYFQRALELDKTFVPAWTNLGVTYRRLKRFREAEESYRAALEVESSDLTATSNLAGLFLAQGRSEEARPLLLRVQNHLESNPFHHYRLGTEALRFGDAELALQHLREANRRSPGEVKFQAALGQAFAALGEQDKARDFLERALRKSTSQEMKADLERRLSQLDQGL